MKNETVKRKRFRIKRKHKRSMIEIGITILLFVAIQVLNACQIIPETTWVQVVVYLIPYLLIGWRVLFEAACHIGHGQVFDENFLMSIATVGALIIGEYPEAVFVMVFYRVGELFEEMAVGRSRASIAELMDIRPDCAHVVRPDGSEETVDPAEVAVGDIIIVKPGERVPLDGRVTEGMSTLDTAALTGESMPREIAAGEDITSGCVNLTGVLHVQVLKPFGESTVVRILDLVENAGSQKSRRENFITRFARYYTPAVVGAAVVVAVLPPLILGMSDPALWSKWVYRALSFLVVSCPCALVISVPLAFFGGIGGAARKGILVKGSGYLEALAGCNTVVFDKTGTLTEGRFSVTAVEPSAGVNGTELLRLAAGAEQYAAHPIARALREGCEGAPLSVDASTITEYAGLGVSALVGEPARRVAVGNAALMVKEGVKETDMPPVTDTEGTTVFVAVDGVFAGRISVADTVKKNAAEAVKALRAAGVTETVMLTGDTETVGKAVAGRIGLDSYRAGLLPADKVTAVEELLSDPARKGHVAFVGDGLNDAPVLARADIGIAMGGMGSDAAIEAADVVLMDDRLMNIPRAMVIARKTLRIVRQNIILALSIKAAVLILTACGLAGLWAAVFGDVGVAVLAILNSMRAMKEKE